MKLTIKHMTCQYRSGFSKWCHLSYQWLSYLWCQWYQSRRPLADNFADNLERGQNYQRGKITSFKMAALPDGDIGAISSANGITGSNNGIIGDIVIPLVC